VIDDAASLDFSTIADEASEQQDSTGKGAPKPFSLAYMVSSSMGTSTESLSVFSEEGPSSPVAIDGTSRVVEACATSMRKTRRPRQQSSAAESAVVDKQDDHAAASAADAVPKPSSAQEVKLSELKWRRCHYSNCAKLCPATKGGVQKYSCGRPQQHASLLYIGLLHVVILLFVGLYSWAIGAYHRRPIAM